MRKIAPILILLAAFLFVHAQDGKTVKVYRASLTQYETNHPIANEFENTLGCKMLWTREISGTYKGECLNGFPAYRTYITNERVWQRQYLDADGTNALMIIRSDASNIAINQVTSMGDDTPADGFINIGIEIYVYE